MIYCLEVFLNILHDARMHRIFRDQVHFPSQHFAEFQLHSRNVKQGSAPGIFYQNINIACRSHFISGKRTEQPDLLYVVLLQVADYGVYDLIFIHVAKLKN